MCGAEKGTSIQSGTGFTSLQKITAKKPFSVKSPEILFVVCSKKKAAGIARLKHLSRTPRMRQLDPEVPISLLRQ